MIIGILQKATDSKTETEKGQEKEIVALAYNSALAKKVSNSDTTAVTGSELNDELDNSEANAKNDNPITVTFTKSKRQYTINTNGEIIYVGTKNDDEQNEDDLPTSLGMMPYLPSESYSKVNNTDLNTGLVISDTGGNEFSWIGVPRTSETYGNNFNLNYDFSIMTDTEITEAHNAIKTALISYAGFPETGEDRKTTKLSWTDEWYDYCGTTYDGIHNYSQIKYISSSSTFNTAKAYYGTIYTDVELTKPASSYSKSATYYAKITDKIEDTTGCGLTYTDYNSNYNTMLESIYTYGGFWVGKYEAGTPTAREQSSDSIDGLIPLSKQNAYPINYITCSQAQSIASKIASTDANNTSYISSLMYGLQWDLLIKYFENKATWEISNGETASYYLKTNSSSWGNYADAEFVMNRGKYAIYTNNYNLSKTWNDYDDSTDSWNNTYYVSNGKKLAALTDNYWYRILYTAGATDTNSKNNLYDVAGNLMEWTLEHAISYTSSPCSNRGGSFNNSGLSASYRSWNTTTGSDYASRI